MSTERILELLKLMEEHGITELEFEEENFRIKLKKGSAEAFNGGAVPLVAIAPQAALPAGAAAAETAAPEKSAQPAATGDQQFIRSPCVGTFFRAPAPDADFFVEVGDQVEPDTVVCIVEAMKVMNEVQAGCHGTVEKILAQNEQAVEYDHALFLIAP